MRSRGRSVSPSFTTASLPTTLMCRACWDRRRRTHHRFDIEGACAMDEGQTAAAVEPNQAGGVPPVALALQGGGSHGAFTWGVLDRLLEDVARARLRITAISGASAGGINATLCACGLVLGGADAARHKLRTFWEAVSRGGALAGNPLFGFAEPGPFGGWNIDWSPMAIALEAVGLVISPYNNPFYRDALRPLLEQVLPATELAAFNQSEEAARVFISATNVRDNQRTIFTQPDISLDALRASACLPTTFRAVSIDGVP